jgi:hypothetical protein
MSKNSTPRPCPDCENPLDRRQFLATTAGVAVAASASSLLVPGMLQAAPKSSGAAEGLVGELHESLSADQKKEMVLSWDDPRRTKINANWHITKASVGKFFTKAQQDLIQQIVKGVTSEDGYDRFLKQMEYDAGGIGEYSVALFGDPAKKPFEFELTGRHLTLRADGNSTPGAAFGGPIVYGHGEEGNIKQNLFFHLTERADEVFKALDEKQRTQALLTDAPSEGAVKLRPESDRIPGIIGSELSKDQQQLVTAVFKDIISSYREEDVEEALSIYKAGGGVEKTRIAFYQAGDLGDDKVWDIWRLESPTVVCHFRGAPHVHAYINVRRRS